MSGPSALDWPLVVSGTPGAGEYVAVRPVGPDEVSFAYQLQSATSTWFDAAPVRIRPGHRAVVDIEVDADTGHESVMLDGVPVLGDLWFARQPVDTTVGTDTIGGPTAPSFPGGVERLSTPTPICDGLRRAGGVGVSCAVRVPVPQAGGPDSRVTVALWLAPAVSVHMRVTEDPGASPARSSPRSVDDETVAPSTDTMVSPGAIPAAAAGLPASTWSTYAPAPEVRARRAARR